MHAMARAGICPNSSPGDPFIIIEESEENSGEKYPVTSSTVAGEPVCWERSAQDATVTTSAADSEQEFRTGHWNNSHENSSLCVETSRGRSNGCCATASCTISEDSGMLPLGPAVRENMECGDDKCKIFGRLSESTTIVAEPGACQSSYQYPDLSQVVSLASSSVFGAQGLQTELEKMKFEDGEQENDTGLRHSPTDDSIGDGVRLDQLAPAAMIAPQPILSGELTESEKFKEFEDTQHGNKENYESFIPPNCGAEFVENGEGLEEPRSAVNSQAKSKENSEETEEKYGELKRGDIEDVTCANREEVLYEPIQPAPSQNEFQSPQRSGRPTRSTVRPSRFRDDAFETQFQPGSRKKICKLCFHPGRGDFRGFSSVDGVCDLTKQQQRTEPECFRSGTGDQEAKRRISKQIGQTRSPLKCQTEVLRPVDAELSDTRTAISAADVQS